MKNINLKVRFNRENMAFILRFVMALAIPVLTYMGLEFQDITNWKMFLDIFVGLLSNPYLLILTFINALNMMIDPTTKGLTDSEKALTYTRPKK